MTVNFGTTPSTAATTNPYAKFGFDPSQPPTISAASVASATPTSTPDKADLSTTKEEKPKRRGPIKVIKDFIRSIKKFNVSFAEYTKATFKGIGEGVIAGCAVYGGSKLFNVIKKGLAKDAEKVMKLPAKPLAIVAGVGVLLANFWKASLDANQKKADVDHRWTTTPIVDNK